MGKRTTPSVFDRNGGRTLWQQHSQSGHVSVAQNAHHRWLEFGDGIVQSAFSRSAPHTLALPYTQWLLAGMMLTHKVERAAVLGLGGGSLASFLARTGIQVSGIDADPLVIEAAQLFFTLPPQRLSIRCCDAREYLWRAAAQGTDLLLVDLFTQGGLPHWLSHTSFHDACAAMLAPGGVACINLAMDSPEALDEILDALRSSYGSEALAIGVPHHANIIALAVNGPHPDSWERLKPRADALEHRLGLPFVQMLKEIFAAHGHR